MRDSSIETPQPAVSIILPTYNREKFLPEAFAAIAGQTFTDWELIVVDDGSTDGTRELVPRLTAEFAQPVRYIYQENQGAYGARNTGLDQAQGKYIAFYDSDDLWLPHHLKACVEGLEANAGVDWVYGACRMVDHASGDEMAESTFYVNGQPRHFLKLKSQQRGNLKVLDSDSAIRCQIDSGLYCGLQNSVLRASIFANLRIPPFRVGEDQLLTIVSLINGFRLGYIDQVNVIYRVHADSLSGSSTQGTGSAERAICSVADAHATLLVRTDLTPSIRNAVRRRLMQEYFWKLGYASMWTAGRRSEAMKMFRLGLHHWPWDWRCWKTYVISSLRCYKPLGDGRGSSVL